MKFLKKLRRKIFGYRPKEVETIIQIVLKSTIDKSNVREALRDIDEIKIACKNVDGYLHDQIMEIQRKLEQKDEEQDKIRMKNWKKK